MKAVKILAIETSCDETAAAVVENGREVLSDCVYSQINHRGGTAAFCRVISRRQNRASIVSFPVA